MIDDIDFGFAVFDNAASFNSNLEKWDTSRVSSMSNSKLSFILCCINVQA